MFVYNDDLEKELFHNNNTYQNLNIITGYITPLYLEKIFSSFNGKIKIYLGMGDTKYKRSTYNSIKAVLASLQNNTRLEVFYTNFDVHAKLYYWFNDDIKSNEDRHILIGSCNFSDSMKNDYKEILGDNYSDSVDNYCQYIYNNSIPFANVPTNRLKVTAKKESVPEVKHIITGDNSALLSLLSSSSSIKRANIFGIKTSKGGVQCASGLNWGLSNNPSNLNDGLIPISMFFIKETELFKVPKSGDRKFKVIWDDGTVMDLMFEGNNNYNGNIYPKQIGSQKHKSTLGTYLRERIGKKINKTLVFPEPNKELKDKIKKFKSYKNKYKSYVITYDMLKAYGRFDIEVTYTGDNTYYFDFSTK